MEKLLVQLWVRVITKADDFLGNVQAIRRSLEVVVEQNTQLLTHFKEEAEAKAAVVKQFPKPLPLTSTTSAS